MRLHASTSACARGRLLVVPGLAVAALVLAACGQSGTDPSAADRGSSATGSPSASPSASAAARTDDDSTDGTVVPVKDVLMTAPAPLKAPLLSPDILVVGQKTLPPAAVEAAARIPGVVATESFSLAQFFHEERSVTYAAVDPATFRRYTPSGSAQTEAVWDRVAGGEMAISPALGKAVQDSSGSVRMGNDTDAPRVHIGAYAEIVPRLPGNAPYVDAVVNQRWAGPLGMTPGNALVVSTGEDSPVKVQKELQQLLGSGASVRILTPNPDIGVQQTAVLTGGSVSAAVGSFTYTANPNGSVNPDPGWIAGYIRTEEVPIIGRVTCNKAMIPELRAALTEVVARGLADKIHPSEYGGCYVPRFIASNPSQGLSFHTFGTAIDLNVPGNQRGTVGQMDRGVVQIFAKWGFEWGGNWHYTDPMHFELHRLVSAKGSG